MKMLSIVAVMVVMAGLAGCGATSAIKSDIQAAVAPATVTQQDVLGMESLRDKVVADLNQAIVDAKASKDVMAPARLACWETILKYVPELPSVTVPDVGGAVGLFDAFERGAEVVEAVDVVADYQIPQQVRVDLAVACGPIRARARDLLAQFNLRLVSVAGQAALLPK